MIPISFIFRKNTKKVRDLWWVGLPPSVRGRVWKLAFGNDLHITQGSQQVVQASVFQLLVSKCGKT